MTELDDKVSTIVELESPGELFAIWLEEARAKTEFGYAEAMCLSTITKKNTPNSRTLMLEEQKGDKFYFFTDSFSETGKELATNSAAAMTFYWPQLERQVRVNGEVSVAREEYAQRFFAKRPRKSQITAHLKYQSATVHSRDELIEQYRNKERELVKISSIPCPEHWQAYYLAAEEIEFWQARSCRLHERVRYTNVNSTWRKKFLVP